MLIRPHDEVPSIPFATVNTFTELVTVSICANPEGVATHRFGDSNMMSWIRLEGNPSVVLNGFNQSLVCRDHLPTPPLVAMYTSSGLTSMLLTMLDGKPASNLPLPKLLVWVS